MKSTPNTVKNTNNANMKGATTMTIQEYAQTIAQGIEGATVTDVEKANGVILTAVVIPTDNVSVKANFYVDDYYKDGADIEDVIDRIREFQRKKTPAFDLDFISDFEQVRPKLRARLFNKATRADVFKGACEYGFDDLIIVPYIEEVIPDGAVKVTSELVKTWGVTPAEVLQIAEENSKQEATINSFSDTLRLMGYIDPPCDDFMFIVTNTRMCYGAYALIAKLDELKARFKNGFTVLPSSVHEVIVVDAQDERSMSAMVNEVNAEVVDPDEQLSNRAYTIAA